MVFFIPCGECTCTYSPLGSDDFWCVPICAHTCVHICTQVCTHVYTQVCTHVYTYVYTCYNVMFSPAIVSYVNFCGGDDFRCVHMCVHMCNVVFMCASNNIQIVFVHEKTHHHKLVRQLELLAVNDVKQY